MTKFPKAHESSTFYIHTNGEIVHRLSGLLPAESFLPTENVSEHFGKQFYRVEFSDGSQAYILSSNFEKNYRPL